MLLFVYNTPGHKIYVSDFIFGTYMDTHFPYIHVKYVEYMRILVAIFVLAHI